MKIDVKYKIVKIMLFCCYAAAVSFLMFHNFQNSSIKLPAQIFGIPSDKVIHFLLFLPCPIMVFAAFHTKKVWRSLLVIFLISVFLAAGIEYSQGFTGYRSPDLLDFAANAAGISVGAILTAILFKLWH